MTGTNGVFCKSNEPRPIGWTLMMNIHSIGHIGTESPEYETLRRGRIDLKVYAAAGSSQESLTGTRPPLPPLPQRCSSLERPNVPLKCKDKDNKKSAPPSSVAAVAAQQDNAPTVPDFHQAAPDMSKLCALQRLRFLFDSTHLYT